MEHLSVELAGQWLRKQLAPEAQAQWALHLEHCPRCRALVDSERSLAAMLALGAAPPPEAPAEPDRARDQAVLDSVPRLGGHGPAGGNRAALPGLLLAAAVLSVLLGAQLLDVWRQGRRLPAEGVVQEMEDKAAAHLVALAALEQDPWLHDDYEVARALEQLVRSYQP